MHKPPQTQPEWKAEILDRVIGDAKRLIDLAKSAKRTKDFSPSRDWSRLKRHSLDVSEILVELRKGYWNPKRTGP